MRYLFVLLAVCISTLQAQAEYFSVRNYDIRVQFAEDGSAEFSETITVEFTQPRHGIYKFIPLRDEINGQRVDRIIKDVRVEGFKVKTSKEGQNFVIRIGDANTYVDGTQVYKIHYRVVNPLNFFEDHIEFYWDLVGINWEVTMDQVQFSLTFPDHVLFNAADALVYTGAAGARGQDATIQASGNTVRGHTSRQLQPQEAVTVALKLDKGAFVQPSGWQMFRQQHGIILIAPFFILIGFIAKYIARNKKQTIMTEYFPPDGISPAIAGGFVDHSVDNNDVLSLIPHLANKGYLTMQAEEGKFLQKDKITFIKKQEAGSDLLGFESQFFNALFSTGDQVTIASLKDKFYVHMAAVKSSVKEWIKQQGWYEADQKTMGCVTGIFGLVALAWGAYVLFGKENFDGVALIVAGIILFVIASRFNKRTPAGNDTYRKLEGFRQFVDKAERPVIERLMKEDPMYYDKTMPYALAFGYLKKWNKNFEGLLTQPPTWYHGPMIYGGDMTRSWQTFSESFPSEMNQVGSVFSSTPSSSGSGGGGGGGFSGGGSGGGGGGSW